MINPCLQVARTWTEYLTARLATVSPRQMWWEMANLARELSLQKLPESGSPITSFNFQGATKALVSISLWEATEFQRRQTQLARARSGIGRFWKMRRRMSVEESAGKWEFMGEITVVAVVVTVTVAVDEDEEEKLELMSCRKMSPSSSSQQQPINWSEIEI